MKTLATLKAQLLANPEHSATAPGTPQWLTKTSECSEVPRWLWLVASSDESVRDHSQDRFGDAAATMLAEHTAGRS